MKIFIERGKKSILLNFSGPVSQLLDQLGLLSEEYFVVRDGALLLPEDKLSDSDSIRILSVVSGG